MKGVVAVRKTLWTVYLRSNLSSSRTTHSAVPRNIIFHIQGLVSCSSPLVPKLYLHYSRKSNLIMSQVGEFDEEELKQAIALSLQNENAVAKNEKTVAFDVHSNGSPVESKPGGLVGLNRKAMEQERLARLASKRKIQEADISPPPLDRKKRGPDELNGRAHNSRTPIQEASRSPLDSAKPQTCGNAGLQFPKGAVKKTWCFGYPRDGDDIKIEELLQKRALKIAVFSSFQWDMEWLVSKLELPRTKLVFVMQAKEEEVRQKFRDDTADWPSLRLCFPPMPGNVNCMHSKLMLLGYEEYLRIVVPTANLTRHDWGESGKLENSVFIIDLPRLSKSRQSDENIGRFGEDLIYFCRAMGLHEDILKSLHDFDFSATEGFAFVHSIGGDHTTSNSEELWKRTGYCGLGRAIKDLGLENRQNIEVDFVISSIGALNEDLLLSLYLACQGDDGKKELNWRTNADNIIRHFDAKSKGLVKTRSKAAEPDTNGKSTLLRNMADGFRVFFPSHETVKQSRGESMDGGSAGGVIFLSSKNYNSPRFPRLNLRDCKSTRSGMLMHNKLMYVRPRGVEGPSPLAWMYLGSSNCSESAWGKLTFNKTSRQVKLNCRNWECGVVIPMRKMQQTPSAIGSKSFTDSMDPFRGIVPIPMKWPGEPMEGKRPWHCTG